MSETLEQSRLSDTVVLDGSVTPDAVMDCLANAVNLAWHVDGNDARCTVPANFIGWLLQENERLALTARKRMAERGGGSQ